MEVLYHGIQTRLWFSFVFSSSIINEFEKYIYGTRAQVVGNGFCTSVVEHWSSNPEDAGSIPSRKALELHFSQLVPFGSYNVYLNDTRISYTLLRHLLYGFWFIFFSVFSAVFVFRCFRDRLMHGTILNDSF